MKKNILLKQTNTCIVESILFVGWECSIRSLSKNRGIKNIRQYVTASSSISGPTINNTTKSIKDSAYDEKDLDINPVGIQHLSPSLRRQLFGSAKNSNITGKLTKDQKQALTNIAIYSLKQHHLYGRKTSIKKPIDFQLPKLRGKTLEEHFQKLGNYMSEPYLTMCKNKFTRIVDKPKQWIMESGCWFRYVPGEPPQKVTYPLENTLIFDVETMPKISPFPVLATAVSDKAWYSWCSPFLTTDGKDNFKHLIPLDTHNKKNPKLIIGHNISYDRARVLEEYNFKKSNAFFLDTLSLHSATAGMCSRQRPKWTKAKKMLRERKKLAEELENNEDQHITCKNEINDGDPANLVIENPIKDDPWVGLSSLNSLKDVASFYCDIDLKKEDRDIFVEAEDKHEIITNFQKLCTYCANDVEATSRVFDKVFPLFLKTVPHPVSFGALRSLSSCFLPVDSQQWTNYIESSEALYQKSKKDIEAKILQIVQDTVKLKDDIDQVNKNPWLKQLDWTIKPLKLTKKGVPVKNQKLPGYPEWYRSLFPNKMATNPKITIKSRQIPLFFNLSWEGFPVIWSSVNGWCFEVLQKDALKYETEKNYIRATAEEDTGKSCESGFVRFKIPHPNGPDFNCTSLLTKSYIHFFQKKVMTSSSPYALEALNINSSGSYWMSSRQRIMEQFVVSKRDFPQEFCFDGKVNDEDKDNDLALILPLIVPMGTITRRAVENTWLTASNAKKNRIGSELKAQVKAPAGYSFVGADVDSEELWIASLVGDSVFNIHGGTPIGWMTLEGTKNEGTDLHTKTAQILGCSRNEAKVFNYGRIYGAGAKFATQLLKNFVPSLSSDEAARVANNLYESTKGQKFYSDKDFDKFWFGGSESILFNKLENIAEQNEPRTPVLGSGITIALKKKNLNKNGFLPSRINWVIQSSGVDYLHLLCCSMNYLIDTYNIDARMCISIHDEIRYLVKNEDKYRAALALQISNLWTRAMFCEQMGMDNLPQNCAFFSAVDIDFVLRKEVDLDCITPSNKVAIPPGESLDIYKLLENPKSALINGRDIDLSKYPYKPRVPVLSVYDKDNDDDFLKYFLKMQVQDNKATVTKLAREYTQEQQRELFMNNSKNLPEPKSYQDFMREEFKTHKVNKNNVSTIDNLLSKGSDSVKKDSKSMSRRRVLVKSPVKTDIYEKVNRRVFGGNAAFDAFYNSVDKNGAYVSKQDSKFFKKNMIDKIVEKSLDTNKKTTFTKEKTIRRKNSINKHDNNSSKEVSCKKRVGNNHHEGTASFKHTTYSSNKAKRGSLILEK
ncbi:related to DNA polymerase gamma [Saccharomycodes ludwigii]|uniref:DNA polymerase gamma n=1 Tax=Saccharomycodes ludwigii TaxID=36035 RepID=A0A376B2E0_9ASCO|nr:related to DNA polymerase gamma [Saccharomycodes ludwigii]